MNNPESNKPKEAEEILLDDFQKKCEIYFQLAGTHKESNAKRIEAKYHRGIARVAVLQAMRRPEPQGKEAGLKSPISDLVVALETDKEYRRSWIANIAMAYIDQEQWYATQNGKKVSNKKEKHEIANLAADHFLIQLCRPIPEPMPKSGEGGQTA